MEFESHVLDIGSIHHRATGDTIFILGWRTALQFALHSVEFAAERFVLGFEFGDAVGGAWDGVFVDCGSVRYRQLG